MNSLSSPSVSGQAPLDPGRERDLLLRSIQAAAARAQLAINNLELIGTSLRHKRITCDEAARWLSSEGLAESLQFGPKKGGAS